MHETSVVVSRIASALLLWAVPTALFAAERLYYIAAEPVVWDYAPSYPKNAMTGQPFTAAEKIFVEGDRRTRVGRKYLKARYVEYQDEAFKTPKPRPPEWRHLGLLGPVIRATVGDTVKIVFKNKTNFPNSMHAHGLRYEKASEGAPYADGMPALHRHEDVVAPGGEHTYVWEVPERAGPGPSDPNSIVWLYHSHVDEAVDTNTGLIGPIIVTRQGELAENDKPKGVDREFIVLFSVLDENHSHYLADNIRRFAPRARAEDEEFEESNLMHSMNGFVYGDLPGLDMQVGERVRWYQLALGTEVDLHTPHWHGNTLQQGGHRVDVINLLPATHTTVDMQPDNPGVWMYHCHVNDHITGGMVATYQVAPPSLATPSPVGVK